MNDKHFVDTNVLVYAHDRSTGTKHHRARALLQQLWNSRSGVVSTQVLQEFCVNVRRRAGRPLSPSETRQLIRDYTSWEVVVNTTDSILEVLEIEAHFRISFWDALIIQAAHACGAALVYSEDLTHGRLYGTVRVVNPFTAS